MDAAGAVEEFYALADTRKISISHIREVEKDFGRFYHIESTDIDKSAGVVADFRWFAALPPAFRIKNKWRKLIMEVY